MNPRIDILIKPLTLRFSLWDGNLVYHFSGEAEEQFLGIEKMMGIDHQEEDIFETNLGFLPTCSTVLIRGEKNIVVDPGNFHMGFYGMVERSLQDKGLNLEDIDIVIATHSHHDHLASAFLFGNSKLIVGDGELEFAQEGYWTEFVDALLARVEEVEYIQEEDGFKEICENVSVFATPGHTPGSISVLVENESGKTAILGDTARTKTEYEKRELSHWYSDSQREKIQATLDEIEKLDPTIVIPGHAPKFEPKR